MNKLTPREREILALVRKGQHDQEIADKLGINKQTVKNHLHAIYRQCGFRNRVEAALSEER